MIGYVTLGTNDVPRAAQYHDELLAVIGSANDGDPGPRLGPFYAGYFRDLDGNKPNAFCMVEGQE